jgi:hypothetical protein
MKYIPILIFFISMPFLLFSQASGVVDYNFQNLIKYKNIRKLQRDHLIYNEDAPGGGMPFSLTFSNCTGEWMFDQYKGNKAGCQSKASNQLGSSNTDDDNNIDQAYSFNFQDPIFREPLPGDVNQQPCGVISMGRDGADGMYLSILAMEYALLMQHNHIQEAQQVVKELYMALRFQERCIIAGNARLGYPEGHERFRWYWFVRTDETGSFHNDYLGHNYGCVAGAGSCSCLEGVVAGDANEQDDDCILYAVRDRKFTSQDQIIGLYMGLAAVARFVPTNVSYEGKSIRTMTSNLASNIFRDLKKDDYRIGEQFKFRFQNWFEHLTNEIIEETFPPAAIGLYPEVIENLDLGWETLPYIYPLDRAQAFIAGGLNQGTYGVDIQPILFPPHFTVTVRKETLSAWLTGINFGVQDPANWWSWATNSGEALNYWEYYYNDPQLCEEDLQIWCDSEGNPTQEFIDMNVSEGVASNLCDFYIQKCEDNDVPLDIFRKFDSVNKMMFANIGACSDVVSLDFLFDWFKTSRPVIPLMNVLLYQKVLAPDDPNLLTAKLVLEGMLNTAPCNKICNDFCPTEAELLLPSICHGEYHQIVDGTDHLFYNGISGWKSGNKFFSAQMAFDNQYQSGAGSLFPGLDYMYGYLIYHLMFTPEVDFTINGNTDITKYSGINMPQILSSANVTGNYGYEGTTQSQIFNLQADFSFGNCLGLIDDPFRADGYELHIDNFLFSAFDAFDLSNNLSGPIDGVCNESPLAKGIFRAEEAIVFGDNTVIDAGVDLLAYIEDFVCDEVTGTIDGLKSPTFELKKVGDNVDLHQEILMQDEKTFSLDVLIKPNPFANQVDMVNNSSSEMYYKLIRLDGTLITQGELPANDIAQINTSELLPGAYFIHFVTFDNQATTYKLIKL